MTRLLIVYGTTDGHPRKIAHGLAEDLRAFAQNFVGLASEQPVEVGGIA